MSRPTITARSGPVTNAFAGELFGIGQPLDASKYFIILPGALGAGKSSKPSDGLRTRFPRYSSEDIVDAQYRLVSEGLGIRHLRLVLGNSGGGMQTWLWGEKYPGFMDVLVPMASQPTAMASRNWMLRRMMIEMIRSDPEWNGGNYSNQPRSLRLANAFFGIATSGGTLAYQKLAPTREKADKLVDNRLAARPDADANDLIYQYDSARDYDPSPALERIEATVLAINSADDERNPAETGITEQAIKRVKNGRLYLIPASEETRGHGTTASAKYYSRELRELLQSAPSRAM
jgi:homoserine O-acetyltransferase/O-succinyltransferase